MGTPIMSLRDFDFDKMPEGAALETLREQVISLCGEMRYLVDRGLLRRSEGSSFALVVKVLGKNVDPATVVDDPNALFDFYCGFGNASHRYAANALRKMRAAVRTGRSTQALRELGGDAPFSQFENVVGVEDDSDLLWGEFPYDGAVVVEAKNGDLVYVSTSGFTKEQDHWFSETTGNLLVLTHGVTVGSENPTEEVKAKLGGVAVQHG